MKITATFVSVFFTVVFAKAQPNSYLSGSAFIDSEKNLPAYGRVNTHFPPEINRLPVFFMLDSLVLPNQSGLKKNKKFQTLSFITQVPANISRIAATPFKKGNLKPVIITGGITTVLILLDEPVIKVTGKFFRQLGIEQQENFHPLIKMGDIELLKRPGNINSFFYQLGESSPTVLLAAGFYLYGKITHSPRAARTASEIMGSFFTTGITVQLLKRITGRQSPNRATTPGGRWHWFPPLKAYQKDVTNYIAYPSGHMATMMSVVTVIAENYPEKKWIRPVGYTLIGLTALSMLNNKVHWVSDFPLGLAIGYLSAKITHRRNHTRPVY